MKEEELEEVRKKFFAQVQEEYDRFRFGQEPFEMGQGLALHRYAPIWNEPEPTRRSDYGTG